MIIFILYVYIEWNYNVIFTLWYSITPSHYTFCITRIVIRSSHFISDVCHVFRSMLSMLIACVL